MQETLRLLKLREEFQAEYARKKRLRRVRFLFVNLTLFLSLEVGFGFYEGFLIYATLVAVIIVISGIFQRILR